MQFNKRLALLTSTFLISNALYGADISQEDLQTLRDWINSKRMITVRELGGQLSISGDIHAEMQATSEVKNGVAQRGSGTGKPNNRYDVEFNLYIDYRTDRTWLAAALKFDNDAGIIKEGLGSATTDKLQLVRAFWGYRLIDGDRHTMDLQMGRHGPIFMTFDSRMQFLSNFDGISLKDSYSIDDVGDVYYELGAFIVNEMKDQAAYIGEIGILNVANTGLYTKYSLIDWDTKKMEKYPHQFQFIVSQWLMGYKWIPASLDRPVNTYAALLYNHRAEKNVLSDDRKANLGGYIGFTVGAIKQAGDWSFDANYQVLEAQCVPDYDVLGIGFGNSPSGPNGFYVAGGKPITDPKKAEGNVNFRGFQLTLQYLISNNLNLWQQWKQSITLNDHIGPFRRYKQYEIDLIYSF